MTRNILLYILFSISFNFLHAGEVNYGGLSMIQWYNGNINSYNSTDIVNNAPVFHQHYYHYLGGNRLKSITSNGNDALDPLLPIQSNNRTFGYDVNGNVNKDTLRQLQLAYGRGNLPYLTAKNTQRTYYAYNTADSRIFKGDSQQGLYYMSGTGVLDLATNQWEYHPTSHTQIKNGMPYFLSLDHLGNTRAVVARNIIEAQYDYYPYGKILRKWENIGSRYLSTKHEKDKETGYDDRKARWYDEDALGFLEIDPLADKFMGWSPYNYVNRNPIKYIDPDGKAPGDPVGPGYYTASSNTRMLGFLLRHPIAAGSIGSVFHGSTNISTNSARFAINTSLPENRAMEGSHINAFRHTLWQATITKEFGAKVAKEAGNTHEENPTANLKQTNYKTLSEADQTIDLLNNVIGREIGINNPSASMQQLAVETLNYFNNNGLYTAIKQKDGTYSIVLTTLTPEQYSNALKILSSTNQNGYTPIQQIERNAEIKAETDKEMQQAEILKGPKF